MVEIERSIKELRKINPSHVTTDKIKILCAKNKNKVLPTVQNSKESKDITEHAKANLKLYDELFQTDGVGKKEAIA